MSRKSRVLTKWAPTCIMISAFQIYLFYQLIHESGISVSVSVAFETKPSNKSVNSSLINCLYSFNSSSSSPITINQIVEEPELYINITSFRENCMRNNESWIRYRMGDMFRNDLFRYRHSGYKYHNQHFPNSIATEYMNKTNKSLDYEVLMKIIENRTNDRKQLIPSNDTIVIHLRTGDAIDRSSFSVVEILQNAFPKNMSDRDIYWRRYEKPLSFYENAIHFFSKYKLKKVLIITGFHRTEQSGNHHKAVLYIAIITKLFEINGYETSVRINNSPDDDIILMCNSRFFVKAGGGFSKLIANIVKRKGAIVFQ